MRDLLITAIVLGSIPAIFFRPYVGIIVWTWISLMNPHRLAWGFAVNFPFAKIVGGATFAAALLSPQRKRIPIALESALLLLFSGWTLLTTAVALEPELAWPQFIKVSKILLLVFVTMSLITDRRKLELFIWMIVLSVGFYGVKGGLFTVVSGGKSHVFGPAGSFIGDNNHLGLAMIMVIPLMRYLQLVTARPWLRASLTVVMILTGIATLGTQSRGAFLGLGAMLVLLAWKSRRRLSLAVGAAIVIPFALALMPESWTERMETIQTYREDRSAMGRINAWMMALNLAYDRPLVGGGFETFTDRWFAVYAPEPTDVHDAHSIYFEVLGEHGFVGLLLYLALIASMWRSCSRLARTARAGEGARWISDLARMSQVSVVGYAVTGAFVGLAYFDLYYNVIAVVVAAKLILNENADTAEAGAAEMEGTSQYRPAYSGRAVGRRTLRVIQ